MSSATPEERPTSIEAREDEPLLGRPGDVTQREEDMIFRNLLTGQFSYIVGLVAFPDDLFVIILSYR
jgi:hypothetical protein